MTASCVSLGLVVALAHGHLATAAEALLRRQPLETSWALAPHPVPPTAEAPLADGGYSTDHDKRERHEVLLQRGQALAPTQAPGEVRHQKEAGKGYLPGSPLYDKQQAIYLREHTWWGWIKYHWRNLIEEGIFTVLLDCLFVMIFAYFWRKHKLANPTVGFQEQSTGDWSFGLFGCFSNFGQEWPVCAMACCCPYVRWADTMGDPNFKAMDFWPSLRLILFLGPILTFLTGGIAHLVVLCVLVFYRQKLRQVYGMQSGGATLCTDCLSWWCCSCCTLIQEAKQVERIKRPNSFK